MPEREVDANELYNLAEELKELQAVILNIILFASLKAIEEKMDSR
ncbi:hypothetical protein [Microbulbifer epialgicus]|uniref:Uncharacterized protein n=1 Tax=Microbulbifer epialgicus TaxID=393907 RepID=A0ABV4P6P1_9GAMM